MRLSLSEIIKKAQSLQTEEEKIEWLKKNDSAPLRTILEYTYSSAIKFLIPSEPPPWKKNGYIDVEGMLYNEARRLKIFIEGGGYDNLDKLKREQLFISLLEDIDNNDAELLCHMISKKPFPGLEQTIVEKAFNVTYPS